MFKPPAVSLVWEANITIKRSGALENQVWQAIDQALGSRASVVALVDDYGKGLKD